MMLFENKNILLEKKFQETAHHLSKENVKLNSLDKYESTKKKKSFIF